MSSRLRLIFAVAAFLTLNAAKTHAAAPIRVMPMGVQPLSTPNFTILPLERNALMATVAGVNGFSSLMNGHVDRATLWPSFVASTHLMQTNLGSIRFFHTVNQSLRPRGQAPMTAPGRLTELKDWTRDFRREVAAAPYPDAHRRVMQDFLRAWDGVLRLSARFPDQHGYDDAQRGMTQIDSLLRRTWDAQRPPSR